MLYHALYVMFLCSLEVLFAKYTEQNYKNSKSETNVVIDLAAMSCGLEHPDFSGSTVLQLLLLIPFDVRYIQTSPDVWCFDLVHKRRKNKKQP